MLALVQNKILCRQRSIPKLELKLNISSSAIALLFTESVIKNTIVAQIAINTVSKHNVDQQGVNSRKNPLHIDALW